MPMQWTPGPGAGFTIGDPWLPPNADADVANVEAQMEDPNSMLWLYRDLLQLPRRAPGLTSSEFRSLPQSGEHVFVFERLRVPDQIDHHSASL